MRNARGIPPGKKVGAIGDELNWEQFISFVKRSGKRRLWIISRDSDYCLTHGKQAVFLIPTLHQELMCLIEPSPEVHAFTNIPEGIKNFSEVTGVKADKLPTPERVEEIKKEQASLPPISGFPLNFGDVVSAVSTVIPNIYGQQRTSTLWVQLSASSPPITATWVLPEPETNEAEED